MATIKQIEANRLNAQKSTGPRTPEGKAAVRFNALKSGIDAESLVIPGEDPEKLRIFIEELTACWCPFDARERELVDYIVHDSWRLRRIRTAENQMWIGSIDDRRKCHSYCDYTEIGDAYTCRNQSFGRMQRQISSIKRDLRDTTHELERIQAARREAESLSPEPLSPPEEPKIKMTEQTQSTPEESVVCSATTQNDDNVWNCGAGFTARGPAFQRVQSPGKTETTSGT